VNISVLKEGAESDMQKPVVDWHHDSYPFVCVLMLSDTEGMVGGETALKTGAGDIMKVRGPEKVSHQHTAYSLMLCNANLS